MGRSRSPLSYWTEGAPADSSWRRETRSSRRLNEPIAVFVVTPAGVIATDLLNADAARWLKAEITQRFRVAAEYKQSV